MATKRKTHHLTSSMMFKLIAISLVALTISIPVNETKSTRTRLNSNNDNSKYPNRTSRFHQQPTRIPGLYNEQFIEPIVGEAHFDRAVLKKDSNGDYYGNNSENNMALVQYYLATCPDCQGFSPYFKRFVADIGGHWRRLVKIYVVNCNDDANQNFCWRENPNLTVPLVRWYTFPKLLTQHKELNYPIDLLNVNQREYIEKQRRDLISLRRATLRFITTTVETLARGKEEKYGELLSADNNALPLYWHSFRQLGADMKSASNRMRSLRHRRAKENVNFFMADLKARNDRCAKDSSGICEEIKNFILFETPGSYIGRQLIADWSNYTCPSDMPINGRVQPILLHYTNDFSIFGQSGFDLKLAHATGGERDLIKVLVFASRSSSGKLKFRFLEDNDYGGGDKDSEIDKHKSRRERNVDRQSERHRESFDLPQRRQRRSSRSKSGGFDPEAQNINWAPVDALYPGEESNRRRFNRAIAKELFGPNFERNLMPIPGLKDEDLGEIKREDKRPEGKPVDPTEEDLSFLTLSDYYKALSEIIHKNIVSKREIDGYQVTTSACFIKKLIKYFPFQGEKDEKDHVNSMAKTYLRLLDDQLIDLLRKQSGRPDFSCNHMKLLESEEDKKQLGRVRITSDEFERMKSKISEEHKIGLVNTKMLKYSYCQGSSEYLRGHTCSLWILFHTLTVEEFINDIKDDYYLRNLYLDDGSSDSNLDDDIGNQPHGLPEPDKSQVDQQENEVYKYTIDYKDTKGKCDPENPEGAFLNSTSAQLFVDAPKFAIANVINFVRFYLTCTNCAAHFSCMVMNSKVDFEHRVARRSAKIGTNEEADKRLIGDHMLWLWEAHNRVNIRTRQTHSEDPLHPKHVFPTIDACPKCYITTKEELKEPISRLDSVKFSRNELIKFLVQRYKRPSILHNKIRIEQLYFRENDPPTTPHPDREIIPPSSMDSQ